MSLDVVNATLLWAFGLSAAWSLGRLAVAAWRSHRAGAHGPHILARGTTTLIGFALAISAALAGGQGARAALRDFGEFIPALVMIVGQLAAGFLASWSVAVAFRTWLDQPIMHWFSGEEAHKHA